MCHQRLTTWDKQILEDLSKGKLVQRDQSNRNSLWKLKELGFIDENDQITADGRAKLNKVEDERTPTDGQLNPPPTRAEMLRS